ncbi:MAG: glutamate-1-semialdehyde 2,1-aminomutase [bacterium]|jgi:glutamate-1-semialdehyde 2,1-aminomutase
MTNDVSKSNMLYERAKAVVPGGIYGHYGYSVRKTGPKFFSKSKGSHFWDVAGNEYIDYMCAYGPMILGYKHPAVDEAALAQLKLGNTISLASPVMVELAAMVARAATGRKKLIKVVEGYHGVTPWMQTKDRAGITSTDLEQVIEIPWNDVDALQKAIDQNPGDIAGFISSPYDHTVF